MYWHTCCKQSCSFCLILASCSKSLERLLSNKGKRPSSAWDAFCAGFAGCIAGNIAGHGWAAHYFGQRPLCFEAALSAFPWNSVAEGRRHRSVTRFLQQLPREGLEQHRCANMGQTRVHTRSAHRTCKQHASDVHLTHIQHVPYSWELLVRRQ